MLASRFTDYRVHRDKYSCLDVGTKEQPSPHEPPDRTDPLHRRWSSDTLLHKMPDTNTETNMYLWENTQIHQNTKEIALCATFFRLMLLRNSQLPNKTKSPAYACCSSAGDLSDSPLIICSTSANYFTENTLVFTGNTHVLLNLRFILQKIDHSFHSLSAHDLYSSDSF